jgi:glyoxalase family protein
MLELISPSYSDTQGQRQPSSQQIDNDIWKESPVSKEHAIRGFHSATLSEEGYERTASLLADTMGFKFVAKDNKEDRFRFRLVEKNNSSQEVGDSYSTESFPSIGSFVDIVCQPEISRGYIGIGTVHHIAWRAANDRHQIDLRKRIIEEAKLNPTPVIDRTYFHSVYFREPGGILFEIATDPPGFAMDERPEDLGKQLKLPQWLEPMRGKLEQLLPPIRASPERHSNDNRETY